jgi:hypothetical protein
MPVLAAGHASKPTSQHPSMLHLQHKQKNTQVVIVKGIGLLLTEGGQGLLPL